MRQVSQAFLVVLLTVFAWAVQARAADSSEGLSTGRYVAGGVVGSAVGFGIGHAIQRRYLPLGLVFTLGEAVTLAGAIADSSTTTTGTNSLGLTTHTTSFGTLGVISLVAYCGLHLWEIIDVWVVGAEYREGHGRHAEEETPPVPPPALAIVPVVAQGNAPGMSLMMRF